MPFKKTAKSNGNCGEYTRLKLCTDKKNFLRFLLHWFFRGICYCGLDKCFIDTQSLQNRNLFTSGFGKALWHILFGGGDEIFKKKKCNADTTPSPHKLICLNYVERFNDTIRSLLHERGKNSLRVCVSQEFLHEIALQNINLSNGNENLRGHFSIHVYLKTTHAKKTLILLHLIYKIYYVACKYVVQ